MKHLIKLTGIIALLAGCTKVQNTSIQSRIHSLKQDDGIVIAEAINNSTIITGPLNDWNELVMWKLGEPASTKSTFSITALKNPSSSFLFAGYLPPGKYRVGKLYSEREIGDVTFYASALAPPALGEFEVKAGEVTNLGTIIYHPFQVKTKGQRELPDYVITRTENHDLHTSVRKAHQQAFEELLSSRTHLTETAKEAHRYLLERLQTPAAKTWFDDENEHIRAKGFELIKRSAVTPFLHPVSDTSFVISGKLGGMYHIENDHIRKIEAPTFREISAFSTNNNQDWVIGGEYGLLMKASPPHKNWQSISISNNIDHVLDIQHDPAGMAWILSHDGTQYNLHQLDLHNDIQFVRSFVGSKRMFAAPGSKPVMQVSEGGIQITIKRAQYNAAFGHDLKWVRSNKNKAKPRVNQKNGYQLASKGSIWSPFSPVVYSQDQGQSWQRLVKEKLTHTFNIPYLFKDGAILIPEEHGETNIFKTPVPYEQVKIKYTENQGKSWQFVGTVKAGCHHIMHNISTDDALYMNCTDGAIYKSVDKGQNWLPFHTGFRVDYASFPAELKLALSEL